MDEVIARHGAPRVLLSDRGKNFLSKVVPDVCKIFQIHKVNTSSYHPQTDSLVERFNSTLCQSLSMYVSKNQKDWDDFIPLVLFAHRTSVLKPSVILLFTFCMAVSLVYLWMSSIYRQSLMTSLLQFLNIVSILLKA